MVHAICLTAIKWLSKVIRIMAAFVYYYWAQLDDLWCFHALVWEEPTDAE
jgi:hypothetical protein